LKLWDEKLLHQGPLKCHYLRTKFHENLPSGSKVISWVHTERDRQTVDLISLLSFLESGLKVEENCRHKQGLTQVHINNGMVQKPCNAMHIKLKKLN
jgi:hypothetical protein